jgi:hypothetical protein
MAAFRISEAASFFGCVAIDRKQGRGRLGCCQCKAYLNLPAGALDVGMIQQCSIRD